jgi:hypothetical protein
VKKSNHGLSLFIMGDETQRGTKQQLIVALALGSSVSARARDNNVPKPTAYRWAKEPEVRKAVQAYRRRILDKAAGLTCSCMSLGSAAG